MTFFSCFIYRLFQCATRLHDFLGADDGDLLTLPLLVAGLLAFIFRLYAFEPLHLPALFYSRYMVITSLPHVLKTFSGPGKLTFVSFAVWTEVVSCLRGGKRKKP